MSLARNFIVTLCLSIATLNTLQAQTEIELDDQAIKRLGIVTAPLMPIKNDNGDKFPATVMNSPRLNSEIIALYSGVLESWLVEPGSSIKRGDRVARINSPELLDLQNQWVNSDYDLQQANFELEKDQVLFAEGIIAEQRYRQTQRNYQKIRSNINLLQEKLVLAGFDKNGRQALLGDNAEKGIYVVHSSGDGKLGHLFSLAGSYIDVNTTIASISSQRLWLNAKIPARIGINLALEQTLRVEGSSVSLSLKQKDFEVDSKTQTMIVQAEFSTSTQLLPGQMVFLIIPPLQSDGVLVPGNAVVHSGDATTVYIKNANGFEIRPVELKSVGSDYLAEVGLRVNEQIVIRGAAILKGIQLGLGGE